MKSGVPGPGQSGKIWEILDQSDLYGSSGHADDVGAGGRHGIAGFLGESACKRAGHRAELYSEQRGRI